jgi:hypothetical protein
MKNKAVFLLFLALLFLLAISVAAQEQETLYCVAELEPVPFNEQGLPIGVSRILSENCFSTPAEAMAFITDGAVSLSLTATQAEAEVAYQQYIASSPVILSSYIVAQLYDSTGYQDLMYQYIAGSPCSYLSGYAASLGGTSYNDRAKSGSAFAGCNKMVVAEHADMGGATLECYPGCSTFGVLNDEVSAWYVIQQ